MRVLETPEFFLFFTTPSCAIHLPREAIPSSADLGALRQLLASHLGARAEGMSVPAG